MKRVGEQGRWSSTTYEIFRKAGPSFFHNRQRRRCSPKVLKDFSGNDLGVSCFLSMIILKGEILNRELLFFFEHLGSTSTVVFPGQSFWGAGIEKSNSRILHSGGKAF